MNALIAAPRGFHSEIITRIQFAFICKNRSSFSLEFQVLFNVIICCLSVASFSLKLLDYCLKETLVIQWKDWVFSAHFLSGKKKSLQPVPDQPQGCPSSFGTTNQWGQQRLNKSRQADPGSVLLLWVQNILKQVMLFKSSALSAFENIWHMEI